MQPGLIGLIGSGETTASGGKVFEWLVKGQPTPLQVALLETPAGFELNSGQVTMRVGDYIRQRLQNYNPEVTSVPARRREPPFSTQDVEVLRPAMGAALLFMGPGSPSYAIRQLRNTLAWDIFQAAHRQGASIALASAATIALGRLALPVYEIFKVGEDPHWKSGLDFFAPYGLDLVIMPHWNNNQGGTDLDTSRCFIGRERFDPLLNQLPSTTCVIGIDEHTSALIDLRKGVCRVSGQGSLHLLCSGQEEAFSHGAFFPLSELGPFKPLVEPDAGLNKKAWELVRGARQPDPEPGGDLSIPEEILSLASQREAERERKNWAASDILRDQLAALGWQVVDSPSGQQIFPLK